LAQGLLPASLRLNGLRSLPSVVTCLVVLFQLFQQFTMLDFDELDEAEDNVRLRAEYPTADQSQLGLQSPSSKEQETAEGSPARVAAPPATNGVENPGSCDELQSDEEEVLWPRPSGLPLIVSDEAPAAKTALTMSDEEWQKFPKKTLPHPSFNRKQHMIMVTKAVPGKFFGLVFPWTIDGLKEAGPKWLTQAFHVAGTLPTTNAVKTVEVIPISVDPMEGEAIGGSSIKAILKVGYNRNAPGLHTKMFCKMPLDPKPDSERVTMGKNWWLDEPECTFEILVAQSCPFRSPKTYFCDYSAESTNFIHIQEALEFDDELVPKKPWVVAKPCLKCKDYLMPKDGIVRYMAFFKRMAQFTAYYQTGRLGNKYRLNDAFENLEITMDDWQPGEIVWPVTNEKRQWFKGVIKDPGFIQYAVGQAESSVMMALMQVHTGVDLVLHVAPQLFEKEHSDPKFLKKLMTEVLHLNQYGAELTSYSTRYPQLVSLAHANTQIDNAVFWFTSEDCTEMDCSLVDWAATIGTPIFAPLGSNLMGGAEPRMVEEHISNLANIWVDSYHENGGSKIITAEIAEEGLKLSMCTAVAGLLGFNRVVISNVPKKDPRWKKFKDRWCPEINDYYVRRAAIAQTNHTLGCWSSKKLNLYGAFKKWLQEYEEILVPRPPYQPDLPKPS